jgi:hypothetical protein
VYTFPTETIEGDSIHGVSLASKEIGRILRYLPVSLDRDGESVLLGGGVFYTDSMRKLEQERHVKHRLNKDAQGIARY